MKCLYVIIAVSAAEEERVTFMVTQLKCCRGLLHTVSHDKIFDDVIALYNTNISIPVGRI